MSVYPLPEGDIHVGLPLKGLTVADRLSAHKHVIEFATLPVNLLSHYLEKCNHIHFFAENVA